MGAVFMKHDHIPEVPHNPWVANLFRPALLTGMMTCLSVGVVNLVKAVNPSWHGKYLLIGMLFVTVEAIYSYRTLKKQGIIMDTNFRYHLVEWGVIVLILKALTYWNDPWEAVSADIKSWGVEPLNFLTMEFVLVLVFSFLIWSATSNSMKAFDALIDQFKVKSGEIDPFRNLANRFYCGGLILVAVSGVAQWNYRSGPGILSHLSLSDISGAFTNVLVYFILGLILLSQTQLDIHFTGWRLNKVDVPAGVIKNWTLQGIIILILVGVVVFFLPTGYSLGFLDSIKWVLQYGTKLFLFLAQFAWAVIIFPLKWLLSLFPLDNESLKTESGERSMFGGEHDIAVPDSDAAYSIVFWIILSAFILYLLRTYLKDHPGLLEWLKHARLRFSWLIRLWQWLSGGFRAVIELIPAKQLLYTNDLDKEYGSKRRLFRLGRATNRQRVIYYYMSTLKRAEEKGIQRQNSQTPWEFAPVLSNSLPDLDEEIDYITQAFTRARFSRDRLESKEVDSLKIAWKHIQSAIRRNKGKKEV